MSRTLMVTAVIIATLGFVDSASAGAKLILRQNKAAARAACHDKVGAKGLSGDPMKAEMKKCMADINMYQ